jgi:branched-chain amino acid transport system permease protein
MPTLVSHTGIKPMHLPRTNALDAVLRPLGQLLLFMVGSSVIISAIVIVAAFLLRSTREDMDLVQITFVLLPQVLIDGITLGFVYATIALGYTMVYGVLEFINFAHGEIFMLGLYG